MDPRIGHFATGACGGAFAAFLLYPGRGPLRPALDMMSFAIICAYAVARFGCFLAHDHPGRFTGSWLGVQYPEGTRFDLGLLYCLAGVATAFSAAVVDRANAIPGSVFAWVATILGLTRLAILPLGDPAIADWIVAAIVAMAGVGAAIFGRLRMDVGGRFSS